MVTAKSTITSQWKEKRNPCNGTVENKYYKYVAYKKTKH